MFQESLMTDGDAEKLLAGVLTTLERAGMMFQNHELLSALEKAGAKVDFTAERAWLPRKMVQEVIEAQKQRASPEEKQLRNRILCVSHCRRGGSDPLKQGESPLRRRNARV